MKNKAWKTRFTRFWLIILALTLFVSVLPGSVPPASAYQPAYTNVAVGIFYGANALPGANLQNVTGYGAGYEFGTLDLSRQFVPLGISTQETKISMLRDRNMTYNSSTGQYTPGSEGSVVVGCFHIQLNAAYSTYAEAAAQAQLYGDGFVKYSNGAYYVCAGEYLSQAEANQALSSRGFTDACVTSGTSATITVVVTGTDRILLEYDDGSPLVVRPLPSGSEKPQTWFKGYRYNGMFQYIRVGGGDLTVINIVDIEDYVKGVIPYEMAPTWPLEALKAQAVCARTYVAANKNKHGSFDVCTTEDCQVYRGRGQANDTTDRAVDETAGQYLMHNGQLAVAFYSSSNGGASENSENVWPNKVPYLRGVMDPYEAAVADIIPNYSWTVTYTREQLTQRLRDRGYNCGTIVSLTVAETTPTGNVYKITLKDENGRSFTFTKGDTIRSILGIRSIRFTVNDLTGDETVYVDEGFTLGAPLPQAWAVLGGGEKSILGTYEVYAVTGSGKTVRVGKNEDDTSDLFVIKGTGYGHNVGMSQWGAYSMALKYGMTYRDILTFYFTDVTIE